MRYLIVFSIVSAGAAFADEPEHGVRPRSLAITNVMMVDGAGTPPAGPVDIVIDGNRIHSIGPSRPEPGDVEKVIDGTGKYVLPGFVNMHGHLHPRVAGVDMDLQYQYNLWLGSGITTVRDVGSDPEISTDARERSAKGELVAPRILTYMWFPTVTGENSQERRRRAEEAVRDLKKRGADGVKVRHIDREVFLALAKEAKKQGLKIAHHVGIEDANAWDDVEAGTSTIEHWYGVPDAALLGVQQFPPDFNHSNELHRFRYAGRLWRETDPERLKDVLQSLIDANVAWDPTFSIYEACRDLQRAVTHPAFDDYLHPALEAFFTPNPEYHGSFFFGWTNTDEVYWKENFNIWMQAVHDFARMGGVVTTGEDAGYIYKIYGFGYLRELQLHEEAGFHPLEVIKHATYNGAKVLEKDGELGRVRPGFLADLVIVNGNPFENLQILLPRGINPVLDEQRGDDGGVAWTIKDGIPYHAPTLFAETRKLVTQARAKREN